MSSIKDSWDNLEPESIRFIFDQAEKNLTATVETAQSLTDRAVNVMQFSVPLSLALMAFIATQNNGVILWVSLIGLAYALLVSRKGLQLYELHKVQTTGIKPSDLMTKELVDYSSEYQEQAFIFSRIQGLDNEIEMNEDSNKKRQDLMYAIVSLVKQGIVVIVLSYPVLLILFEAWKWFEKVH